MSPQNAAADLAARGVMPRTSGAVSGALSTGDEAGAAPARALDSGGGRGRARCRADEDGDDHEYTQR